MTTNGFLLNKEKIKFLVDSGVTNYQITIDGLESDHDKLRPLRDGSGSWARIIENLRYFKELKKTFLVIIRINFNLNSMNEEKLRQLLDILSFTRYDIRFKFIFRGISNYAGANSRSTSETNKVLYKENDSFLKIINYSNILLDNGYLLGDVKLFTNPAGLVCYASFPQNLAVNGAGEILRCTIAVDQSYNNFGKINFKEVDFTQDKLDQTDRVWESNLRLSNKCYNCKILFQCLGRNCPIKNLLKNDVVCPREAPYVDDVLKLILKQKNLLKQIWRMKNSE